jgi:hypothetical protein
MKKKIILAVFLISALTAVYISNSEAFKEAYHEYLWQKNRLANDNFHTYSQLENLQVNDFIKFESLEGTNKIKSYNYAKIIEVSEDS